MLKYFF